MDLLPAEIIGHFKEEITIYPSVKTCEIMFSPSLKTREKEA